MLNKIAVVVMSLVLVGNAWGRSQFEKQLGRELTVSEAQSLREAMGAILVEEQTPQLIFAAAQEDNRTIGYNMGCLTTKAGATVYNVQKLVCMNVYGEVFTIAKSTGSEDAVNTFSLSASAGVMYVRMHVNEGTYNRLQSLQLIEEPVDAIGVDLSKGLVGAQILFLSSPNVSVKLAGWLPGLGGGLSVEQNGNVDRATYRGSMLTVKKFNF